MALSRFNRQQHDIILRDLRELKVSVCIDVVFQAIDKSAKKKAKGAERERGRERKMAIKKQ